MIPRDRGNTSPAKNGNKRSVCRFLVYRRRHPESKGRFVNYWAVRIAKHGQRRLNPLAIPDAES